VQTELVTVPVVVTDKAGKHVTGLKQSDFTLEENGHKRQVATFEEVVPTTSLYQLPPQSPAQYTNFIPAGQGIHRISIIVLDLLNTPFARQTESRRQIIKFLADHLTSSGPTSLFVLTASGLHQVHSFTNDPAVLIAAMKKTETSLSSQDQRASSAFVDPESHNPLSDPSTLEMAQANQGVASAAAEAQIMMELVAERADAVFNILQDRVITTTTLQALEQLAQAYSGIPGRKALIWTTGGLPFTLNDPDSITGMDISMRGDYDRAFQALNSAAISVYPIDANGLMTADLSQRAMEAQRQPPAGSTHAMVGLYSMKSPVDRVTNAQDSMRAFAKETGGKACMNNNDLASCFARAEDDASQYYLLGYYLTPEDRKPGWRSLKVRASAEHDELRAREGFFVGDTKLPKERSLRQQFDAASTSPLDYTGVPLGIKLREISGSPSTERKVAFSILIAPNGVFVDEAANNHIAIELDAVAQNSKNQFTRVFSKVLQANLKPESMPSIQKVGMAFSNEFTLPPGKYATLRFILRDDATGKMGTVTAPLDRQLP
jgi:VWFA-related protein